ncbi:hypothetical protein [Arcobacter arenosus]|uniref:Uncharacterized protein n=1 Tax=Arcobacter arenosus TaxID=2576037 RepID=A0A5R8Y503_9BACT|nr:hypothetical protein [Arcobacter arenosus]TLP41058.1 hypothetical protein FDK22_03290 [Arcobacter arenosus]
MCNKRRENIEFHAKLKSATQAYAQDKGVTWSCYFGDLLFPSNPNGEEQFKGLFNQTKLTSWHIALLLEEIGNYAYPVLHNKKIEKYETEEEFKDEMINLMDELGETCRKAKVILDDENKTFDPEEAKRLSSFTQRILSIALNTHLRTEKSKHWE